MKALLIFFIALLPVLAYNQKPMSDYTPVNAGDKINTEYDEWFPMLLPDGLTLYFSSNRPGGQGDLDIYVCSRKSVNESWGKPLNLGTKINTSSVEHSVTVSEDRHWMLFTSEKQGGFGTGDLYVSYRKDVSDPLGWGKAKNAGAAINSSDYDACALFHQEGKTQKVYFTSNRKGGVGKGDAYVSSYQSGKFTAPVLLKGLNSLGEEMHFVPDEGLIWANREGGCGGDDIWITLGRKSTYEWQTPTPLSNNINTTANEGMPSMTKDKSLFVFHSDRPGGKGKYDIYFATPTQ